MHACKANPSTGFAVRKQIDAFVVVVVTNNVCDNNLFIVTNVLEEV